MNAIRSNPAPRRHAARLSVPRLARLAAALALVLFAVPPAVGAFPVAPGSSGKEEEAKEKAKAPADSTAARHAQAEKEYATGYEEAMAGKRLAAADSTAQATDRFAAALERFDEAVRLDPRYADAWNMIGFCARHVGDLMRSFQAYQRALEIDPEMAAAHEYLGEAYVQAGDLEKAKEQLAWLRSKASPLAKDLDRSIARAEGRAPADADSSETGGSGW